jgi:intracellular sulfur oxidation DsrE/DsrF family protein
MAEDGDLRGRVCQLWQVKEMLRGAYPEPEAPSAPPLRRPSRWQRWGHALAAAVVLCVGTVAGWFAHGDAGAAAHVGGLQLYARQMDEGKVILHLSSAAPDRLKTALDEADELSRSNDRSGHPMQVEVLANGDGLSLMRSDVSPYAERIAALKRAHPNLKFIACNNAMEMLRLSGVEVMLLPEVSVAPSAIDEIMMRLQQGWAYVRV